MNETANHEQRSGPPSRRPSRRYLIFGLKILVPILILSWLFWKERESILDQWDRPKDWALLAISLVSLLTLTCVSFFRWFLLVRALEIPFTIRQAVRLGFLGYLFNFVGPGAVGGDLFKAYFVAQGQQERKAEAVATILLDRVLGMFCLLCVASCAVFMAGVADLPQLGTFLKTVVVLTIVGGLGILLLLLPSQFTDWLFEPMSKWPLVGNVVIRVRAALALYRKRRLWLLIVFVLGVTIHMMMAMTIRWIDLALHPEVPKLAEHMIISPLASVASAAPVPGGLGTYEAAMDFLFQRLPSKPTVDGQGLHVAIVYRLITIVIAAIGAVYYALNRGEITQVVSEIDSDPNSHSKRTSNEGSGR